LTLQLEHQQYFTREFATALQESLLSSKYRANSAKMPSVQAYTNGSQRDRSRSPRRRSRSPRRSRRSYSPRSRSRSRGDDYRRSERRSRSPMSGAPNAGGGYSGSGSGYGGRGGGVPQRSFEDRAAAKEQMMQSVRESSQQERRVYVGNLAYDVKWHHLKDFMRQGMEGSHSRSMGWS
jgi:RNA recognition motif-containing protein